MKNKYYNDAIKGEVEFPENDIDTILLKSDKYPTYHFAHVIDDHLMRVTHIIRGDEWLSSFPIHYQLFNYFHFFLPAFGHISPLLKKEEDRVRKISKRKDPEAKVSIRFYFIYICRDYNIIKISCIKIFINKFFYVR